MKLGVRIFVSTLLLLVLCSSAQAGWFGGSRTQKLDYNRTAWRNHIMEHTTSTRQNAEDIVRFFTKRTKLRMKDDDRTAMIFAVLVYHGEALGAVIRAEGKRLIVEINYNPLPMDVATFNQFFRADVERRRRSTLITFRHAEEDGLVSYDERNRRTTISAATVEDVLSPNENDVPSDKRSPFSEVFILHQE